MALGLTKATAVEFNTHGDESVPSLRVDTNISCDYMKRQCIVYNGIVIQISFKHLSHNTVEQ